MHYLTGTLLFSSSRFLFPSSFLLSRLTHTIISIGGLTLGRYLQLIGKPESNRQIILASVIFYSFRLGHSLYFFKFCNDSKEAVKEAKTSNSPINSYLTIVGAIPFFAFDAAKMSFMNLSDLISASLFGAASLVI